ncbi:MAG TPA: hypothetical protein VHR47_08825 [Bacillota bacterium]|nr:hypothetical protein [Bacillota bacterium]
MESRVKTWMVMSILAAALVSSVAYAGGQRDAIPFDRADLEMKYGKLTVIEGEIRDVSEERLTVDVGGRSGEFLVDNRTKILMNGRPALLKALRPVTEEAYFIGRIWHDSKGIVRLVEGDYRGVSVRILSYTEMADGSLRLRAQATEEAGEPERQFETTWNCRGIDLARLEEPMVEAYLLFDLHGKVRGIFF